MALKISNSLLLGDPDSPRACQEALCCYQSLFHFETVGMIGLQMLSNLLLLVPVFVTGEFLFQFNGLRKLGPTDWDDFFSDFPKRRRGGLFSIQFFLSFLLAMCGIKIFGKNDRQFPKKRGGVIFDPKGLSLFIAHMVLVSPISLLI